jgi:hypothetical protein
LSQCCLTYNSASCATDKEMNIVYSPVAINVTET